MAGRPFSRSVGQIDRRGFLKLTGFGAATLVAASVGNPSAIADVAAEEVPPPFNMETGIAPVEIIVPTVVPIIFGLVSPTAGDATIVLRFTSMITAAWFDAIAPYHPTATGIYSTIARQPATESTNANKNVATLYASFRVLSSLLPEAGASWRAMLESVGLDPEVAQQNDSNPTGIGNLAGMEVVSARLSDGMNQSGDEGGGLYNRFPYADYTGYEPENSAYHLKKRGRWQPDILTAGAGLFQVQQHVTPQMALTDTYTGLNLNNLKAPTPKKSQAGMAAYKKQVDEVLAASAAMTDEQKMMAEFFDNKLRSLGFSALFIFQTRGFGFDEFVQYDCLVNLAAFDTAVLIWKEKLRYDAVRPFSAIKHVYDDSTVTAWGGPGKGTVSNLSAGNWRSYIQSADHSEYPSGSSAFCAAHAEASRYYLGSDDFGWSVPIDAGSSRIETGITPANDIVLHWDTWTDFETDCGMSRFWSGVHFKDSITEGAPLGRAVGHAAYQFLQARIDGTA
jgi:hypothetical protein